jgi:hypothetical protein
MIEKNSKAWKATPTSSSSSEDLAVKGEKSGLDIGSQDVSPVPGVLPAPADADEALDQVIERLPTQFRTEILKQYDMPTTKYGYFTIFRWATPLEVAMQIFGLLMAFGAGTSPPPTPPIRHAPLVLCHAPPPVWTRGLRGGNCVAMGSEIVVC